MHPVERDIRKWSHEFLEKPSDKLNGLPPCPYAKQAWLEDKVIFSINTGLDGLTEEIKKFDTHDYDIVVWANEDLPEMAYLDGWCDGVNEAMSIAEEAGLDFLVDDGVTDDTLEYCMVFVQLLSKLDDAALSLEKSGYYKEFPEWVYQSLVLDRRKLRNGNER